MLEPESGRDLLRRPAPLKTGLDRRQQPRARRELGRLRSPGARPRPALGRQRPIPRPLRACGLDLAPDRAAMAPQRPGDLAIALAGAIPRLIRSRSSNDSRCGECATRRRANAACSAIRNTVRTEHPNSSASSPPDRPAPNRAAIRSRSPGRTHRYDPLDPPTRPPIARQHRWCCVDRMNPPPIIGVNVTIVPLEPVPGP
jgi:hypothetical protein